MTKAKQILMQLRVSNPLCCKEQAKVIQTSSPEHLANKKLLFSIMTKIFLSDARGKVSTPISLFYYQNSNNNIMTYSETFYHTNSPFKIRTDFEDTIRGNCLVFHFKMLRMLQCGSSNKLWTSLKPSIKGIIVLHPLYLFKNIILCFCQLTILRL